MARALAFDLVARDKGFSRGLGQAEKRASGFQRTVGRLSGAIAGAFAGGAVLGAVKGFTDAARESQLVAAQTDAVIRSTRGAAKLSAQGFADLAGRISKTAAVDDDLIQGGENLLATFTAIKAGGPDKVFERATQAAVDMAAALNQGQVTADGLKSANIQLGKALNDPIKGVSALQRVGVSFTDQQKAQIKTLVSHGQTAKAQGIILAEVNKEFGGSAAAAATSGKRLSVVWGNAQETLGGLLIPVIDRGARALAGLVGWVDRNRGAAAAMGGAVALAAGILLAHAAATKVVTAVQVAAKAATVAWRGAQVALNFALAANPIGLVIVAVAALAAGLVLAYRKSETFRAIVDKAWSVLKAGGLEFVRVTVTGLQFLVRTFLGVAGAIVRGAAFAFGWMPGIGPKLKGAAAAFGRFEGQVNAALANIKDKVVTVQANAKIDPRELRKGLQAIRSGAFVGMAEGGWVTGPGGPTADRVPRWLSAGEFVVSAAAARRHAALLEALNRAPGMTAGGLVARARFAGVPGVAREAAADQRATEAAVRMRTQAVANQAVGRALASVTAAPPHAPGGWRVALAFLSRLGIPYHVVSTFRPGARTHATGAVSYHALNRAVDLAASVPGMLRIWQALTRTNPTELIYSRAPFYRSRRGWRRIGLLDPVTRADHYSHVHAAYDQGGWLPPGLTMAVNRTGRSEPVGFDYDQLAAALVRALRAEPPVVRIDQIHRGTLRYRRDLGGVKLGYDT